MFIVILDEELKKEIQKSIEEKKQMRASKKNKKPGKLMLKRRHKFQTQSRTQKTMRPGRK